MIGEIPKNVLKAYFEVFSIEFSIFDDKDEVIACNNHVTGMFKNKDDWNKIAQNDMLYLTDLRDLLKNNSKIKISNKTKSISFETSHSLSSRQIKAIIAGSLINLNSVVEKRICDTL